MNNFFFISKFKWLQMLENWSFANKNNLKLFAKTLTVSLVIKTTYQWVKSKKEILAENHF